MIEFSYVFAGALTGFLVGLTGVGGGALMTPILLLFFGVPATTAIATDLWFSAITKTVAAGLHNKAGQVDWLVVKRLWMGSLPVALLVVIAVSLGSRVHKMDWLSQAVGLVILITAVGMVLAPGLVSFAQKRRVDRPDVFKAVQPALTVVSGAMLGLSVALTSVGAGALGSVMLLFLYPLRMKNTHRLVATDIVHAIPLAVVAGSGYLIAGMVNASMLASLLVGSIPSVVAGCLLAGRVSARRLQIMLACVLILAGLKTLSSL